jgi:hypothetical protein
VVVVVVVVVAAAAPERELDDGPRSTHRSRGMMVGLEKGVRIPLVVFPLTSSSDRQCSEITLGNSTDNKAEGLSVNSTLQRTTRSGV